MTTERKIEILTDAKKCSGLNGALNGICTAIMRVMQENTLNEVLQTFTELLKHKPNGKYDGQLWFDLEDENIPIRLAIIDEMIIELKTQLK